MVVDHDGCDGVGSDGGDGGDVGGDAAAIADSCQ